jgi:hypothetical protein
MTKSFRCSVTRLLGGARRRLTTGISKAAEYLARNWISVLALVISIVSPLVTLYFTYYRHIEDLRVYLRFPEPLEVGSNTLHLNYFFSNRGNEPVMVEDVSIIELWIKSEKSNIGGAELQACDDPTLFRPDFIAALPKQFRNEHVTMKSGASFSSFRPVKTYIDGTEGESSAATVEPGKMKAITTTFEPDPVRWENYNTVVICPVIRFFDSQGRPLVATCKAWQSTTPNIGGTLMGPPWGGPSAKLLPISSDGSCRSLRVAAEFS